MDHDWCENRKDNHFVPFKNVNYFIISDACPFLLHVDFNNLKFGHVVRNRRACGRINWARNQAHPFVKESGVKLLKSIDFDFYGPKMDIEEKVSALEKARSVRCKRSSNADLPYSVPAPVPLSTKMFFVWFPASDESLDNFSALLKKSSNRCTTHQ